MGVKALGYVVIETTQLKKWDRFLTEIVGAMPAGKGDDGAALYRLDGRAARFRLIESERDALSSVGWEVADRDAFDVLLEKLRDFGCHVTDGDARSRGVTALACFVDPAGSPMEIFYGADEASTAFSSSAGVSGFVTGELGMGHVVYAALNFAECHDFYRAIMGFGDTDLPEIEAGPPGSPKMGIAFMHTTTGRHHSVAVIQMPPPPFGCVHLMVEASSMADVELAYERAQAADVPISATLGQHQNDEVTSFYMQSPSGFDIEFGFDGLVIDPSTWVTTAHTEISKWGHEWAWQKAMKESQAAE
jgi:3,4-dihydroxy-9,10-secoandrosta-1,3,5(10)-triene-9,17-dione 4,5-dioxygenase